MQTKYFWYVTSLPGDNTIIPHRTLSKYPHKVDLPVTCRLPANKGYNGRRRPGRAPGAFQISSLIASKITWKHTSYLSQAPQAVPV